MHRVKGMALVGETIIFCYRKLIFVFPTIAMIVIFWVIWPICGPFASLPSFLFPLFPLSFVLLLLRLVVWYAQAHTKRRPFVIGRSSRALYPSLFVSLASPPLWVPLKTTSVHRSPYAQGHVPARSRTPAEKTRALQRRCSKIDKGSNSAWYQRSRRHFLLGISVSYGYSVRQNKQKGKNTRADFLVRFCFERRQTEASGSSRPDVRAFSQTVRCRRFVLYSPSP